MKTELGLPNAIITSSKPEGNSIAEELAIEQAYDNSNPMYERDCTESSSAINFKTRDEDEFTHRLHFL